MGFGWVLGWSRFGRCRRGIGGIGGIVAARGLAGRGIRKFGEGAEVPDAAVSEFFGVIQGGGGH